MAAKVKRPEFMIKVTDGFDARKGMKRCSVPGVGVRYGNGPSADADFWRDSTGKVMVRFSSRGYTLSCEGTLGSGNIIAENQLGDLRDYIEEILLDWLANGVDDYPDCFY